MYAPGRHCSCHTKQASGPAGHGTGSAALACASSCGSSASTPPSTLRHSSHSLHSARQLRGGGGSINSSMNHTPSTKPPSIHHRPLTAEHHMRAFGRRWRREARDQHSKGPLWVGGRHVGAPPAQRGTRWWHPPCRQVPEAQVFLNEFGGTQQVEAAPELARAEERLHAGASSASPLSCTGGGQHAMGGKRGECAVHSRAPTQSMIRAAQRSGAAGRGGPPARECRPRRVHSR